MTQSYDKTPYTSGKLQTQNENTNTPPKCIDYTAVAKRIRTVRWSNYSHPNVVGNWFTGLTFLLPTTTVRPKGQIFENFVNNHPYRDGEPTHKQSSMERQINRNSNI